MKSFDYIRQKADELAEEILEGAEEVRAEKLGLDRRGASRLFAVPEDCDGPGFIAVPLEEDRTLQYYGGFEYVDKGFRCVIGGYVFYSGEDDRVARHLSRIGK